MAIGSGYHIIPLGDLVGHETLPDCVCGPDISTEQDADNPRVVNFIFRHHALDGRKHPDSQKKAS